MDNARETLRGIQWIGIVLALAVVLALAALWILRPESTHGAVNVSDPTPGQVFQVSVDMDTTGNPAPFTGPGLIPSLDASASVAVAGTRDIDIIVDEVDPSDGIVGYSFNLKFDPAVVKINSKIAAFIFTPVIPLSDPLPCPGSCPVSGNWRADEGTVLGSASGEGVLIRLTLECLGNGTSVIDLADDVGGDGIPDIIDASFGQPPVLNAVDGQIVCGTGGTATPTPDPGTATPTPDPATATPTPDPATATPTPDPATPTPTPVPATPTPTPGAATPTATSTASASATPTPTATATPSASPSSTSTPGGGTETPTPTPATDTATPTPAPTAGPSLLWGDDNCSGSADPVDALLTLRHDAGLSANTGDCPGLGATIDVAGASPHPWGDVDCSGAIDPVDSLKLLRSDAGLSVPQGAGCPKIGSTVLIG